MIRTQSNKNKTKQNNEDIKKAAERSDMEKGDAHRANGVSADGMLMALLVHRPATSNARATAPHAHTPTDTHTHTHTSI